MPMFLRTDKELDDALTHLAELEGVSRQEVVRRAVLERLQVVARDSRVEESSVRVIMRWKDVLDRLGRA